MIARTEAMLDFSVELALDGEALSAEEKRALLNGDETEKEREWTRVEPGRGSVTWRATATSRTGCRAA